MFCFRPAFRQGLALGVRFKVLVQVKLNKTGTRPAL